MNRDWQKISDQVDKGLEEIEKATGAADTTPDAPRKDMRFGGGVDLQRASNEAATVMHKVPPAFTTIGFTEADVRDNAAAAQAHRDMAAKLHKSAGAHEVKAGYYEAVVSAQTGKVYDVTEANEINPAPLQHTSALKKAAEPLRTLVNERRAAISSSRNKGKTVRTGKSGDQQRIRSLELENKFLAGEELRPEDLDPGVAAKKGTRRSPRSTPR